MEDIKSRGYFCNYTEETVIISQRKRWQKGEKMAEKTEEIDRWEERKWRDESWYENDTDWGMERFDLKEKKTEKCRL